MNPAICCLSLLLTGGIQSEESELEVGGGEDSG